MRAELGTLIHRSQGSADPADPFLYLTGVEARTACIRREVDRLASKGYVGKTIASESNGEDVAFRYEIATHTDAAIRQVLSDFLSPIK